MDPVTGLLLGGSVLSSFLGGSAANDTAAENLAFQKQEAAKQDKLSRAAQIDALGNETSYNEALNKWVSTLSPTQQRIAKGGEHEQLLNLMLDAPKNRAMRDQAYARAGSASDAADTELAKLRFGGPQSEGSIDNELTGLMSRARTGQTSYGTTAPQNLRQRGKVAVIRSGKPSGGNGSVDDIAQILLQARQQGLAEKGQRDQQFNATTGGRLGTFSQVAQGGGAVPINTSNMVGKQDAQQARMAAARAQALSNISSEVGGAYQQQGKAESDFGNSMAKTLSGFKPRAATTKPSTDGYYGGSPETNYLLNPSTYGNMSGPSYTAPPGYEEYMDM